MTELWNVVFNATIQVIGEHVGLPINQCLQIVNNFNFINTCVSEPMMNNAYASTIKNFVP